MFDLLCVSVTDGDLLPLGVDDGDGEPEPEMLGVLVVLAVPDILAVPLSV